MNISTQTELREAEFGSISKLKMYVYVFCLYITHFYCKGQKPQGKYAGNSVLPQKKEPREANVEAEKFQNQGTISPTLIISQSQLFKSLT